MGAWFVQDTIKLRPNLTLALGLRHELTNGWNEAHGRLSEYRVDAVTGVLLTQPAVSSSAFTANNGLRLFAPRIGLAWDLFGNGKTVLHTGIGIYYDLVDDLAMWSNKNPPINLAIQLTNTTFPFPQITRQNFASIPGSVPAPYTIQQNLKTPTIYSYNLKIEQGVGASAVLSVGYAGSHGSHEAVVFDGNTIYPLICGVSTQPYPVPSGASCPTPAGIQGQTLFYPSGLPTGTLYFGYKGAVRRNPALGTTRIYSSAGNSNYDALLIGLTERAKYGLSFKANYTWSKSLDEASDDAGAVNTASTPLNPEDIAQEYALSAYNIAQRFSFSGSYDLPVGKGKEFWPNLGRSADKFVSGWQLNTIVSIQTGLPFYTELGFSQSGNGNTAIPDRPSWNPSFSGPLYLNTPKEWYNPNAFILPAAGTYGDVSRNTLTGPPLREVDLSLLKGFTLSERMHLQFRAEAFNVLNTANFGIPNLLVLNPNGTPRSTAGQITTTSTTSRQLQFGLKVLW